MLKQEIFQKAYEVLDQITSLKSDCGRLCNQACCNSADEDAGMYLFPGEESVYAQRPAWLRVEQSTFTYGYKKAVSIAICTGQCDRELRPLACRIFPLTPYIGRNGIVSVKIDPRAVPVCPLTNSYAAKSLDKKFVLAVNDVSRILCKDKEIYSYILSLSRLIDDQENLFFRFTDGYRKKKHIRAIYMR